jgi:uncharacterized phage protein (TIGR02218 family)
MSKSASGALVTLLTASREFKMADLYTFSLLGGTVLRYASADLDIKVGALTFSSSGPWIRRGRTRLVIGLEVDTLEVTVHADATHLVAGVPWLTAVRSGAFDGASVKLERAFMSAWGDTSAGTVILFEGRVAEAIASRTEAKLTVRSDLELLNIKLPRNLYQPGCIHTLYDAGCGLSKAAFAVNTSTTSGSTKDTLNCGLTQTAGYFDLGTVTFTGGPNAGVTRTVKSYSPGVFKLSYPLPSIPNLGNGFTAYPGCDKLQATCQNKFGNLANFRGFPYIPVPETSL